MQITGIINSTFLPVPRLPQQLCNVPYIRLCFYYFQLLCDRRFNWIFRTIFLAVLTSSHVYDFYSRDRKFASLLRAFFGGWMGPCSDIRVKPNYARYSIRAIVRLLEPLRMKYDHGVCFFLCEPTAGRYLLNQVIWVSFWWTTSAGAWATVKKLSWYGWTNLMYCFSQYHEANSIFFSFMKIFELTFASNYIMIMVW